MDIEITNIEQLTKEILQLKKSSIENMLKIGEKLLQVKKSLPHGEFGKYLKENVDISTRSANRFMKVTSEFLNKTTLSNLEPSKLVILLDVPKDHIDEFSKENNLKDMSCREIREKIKEFKKIRKKEKREIYMIKKMYFNILSKWIEGSHKGTINWGKSIGRKIKFIYNNIIGEVEIVDYDGEYLWIKYSNKKPFKIQIDNFKNCKLGKLLGEKTDEFKIEIGQTFKNNNRDLIVTNRKIIKDKNGNKRKMYKYKCNKCGFECGEHYKNGEYKKEYWILESNLLNGTRCSCCNGNHIVVPEINSIIAKPETQWMIKYFQGGYDEAMKYSSCSNQKINPICPECGKVKVKSVNINTIYRDKSINCICSDGCSYPFKLMYSILKQFIQDNFKTEYSPKWISPKRYDFYFELNNKKYIVEMDGGLGHGHSNNCLSGRPKEETKASDEYKDLKAKEYRIEVIRIDCNYGNNERLTYVKNNILNSELNELFDLNKINWNLAEEFALNSLVKKACEIKRDNPNITITEIGKIMSLSKDSIKNYLKKGSKIWDWINYDPKEEMRKSGRKNGKINSKPVKIFKDGILLGIFESALELERCSEELFGIKLDSKHISSVCLGKRKSHKGYIFKFCINI